MEDSDQNKLFVGGISWETTDENLRSHFGKYGTVVGSVIAKDRNTGSPRGFAFVSFSDPSAVDKALQDTHNILGRTVEVKKAIPRSEQNQSRQQQQSRGLSRNSRSNGRSDEFRTKKIFVGGLSANLTEEEFRTYFEKFGRITDVVVMHDNVTHRPRGFGFITFDSEDAVEDVMQKSFHELTGKLVEVKRAVPKEGNSSSNGYTARVGSGGGPNFNSYQNASYSPYSAGYGILSNYGPLSGYGGLAGYPYGAGMFGGYSVRGYGGFGYGMAPLAPRSPWNVGFGGSPLPYDSSANVYPAYLNGGVGVMGMGNNAFNGIVGTGPTGKSSQLGGGSDAQVLADATSTQIDRVKVEFNSDNSGGNYNTSASKSNQKGIDGRFRPYTASNSS
ncbi:hypothetical protein RJ639_018355 [Escallonia herrerae]|uniref:RRM domain-containing protein n=1 Tax=Escallonia herrerae TaxID=1293975 RepID=A0AA88V9W0_9ASTE|nr:hypothetical protein RJ639_018355 [Escallonia herrerae]